MKAKSGYAKSEKKEAGMKPEKRPETLSKEMVNQFNAAVQGKVYQPKQKK